MEISTPQGRITFTEPESEKLKSLRSALPLGLVGYSSEVEGAKYGIVMKCGEEEAWAVKQQSIEIPEEDFEEVYMCNSILIALSIRAYMEHGFGGVLMPCPYLRSKPQGIEAGFAYFGTPLASGIEAAEFPFEGSFDQRFGHGFTTMFIHFMKALRRSSEESEIPLQPALGLDIRPRSALESLGMQFLIHGTELYCLKTRISERDPVWEALSSAGIKQVVSLPSVPAEIPPDQLQFAKTGRIKA